MKSSENCPSVAVIDTGIAPQRLPRASVLPGVNLTHEGFADETTDGNGHGTMVAATIVRHSVRARIVPVKLMGNHGYLRAPEQLEAAFDWILEHRKALGIGIVCSAFADASHVTTDERYSGSRFQKQIATLRKIGVATVAPAGNRYRQNGRWGVQGMAWPAILRDVISVGAVQRGSDGLNLIHNTQRLHAEFGTGCCTTVFVEPDEPGETSGAAAVVAGCLAGLRASWSQATVDQLIERLFRNRREARDESSFVWPSFDTDEVRAASFSSV